MPTPRHHRLALRAAYVDGPRIASALRKRWAKLKNPTATVTFGPGTYLGPGFSLHAPAGGTFEVGAWCEFRRGFRCELGQADTVVRFGDGCVMTYDVLVQCTTSITFGDRVIVGQSTLLVDGNHHFRDPAAAVQEQGYVYKPLRLGDDAFVMTKCTIVADLGERAVVGANTLVTRDVPPYHVVGGVPAKVLDTYGPAATMEA